MADRNDDRNNRRSGGGGDKRQPPKQDPKPKLHVSGTKKKTQITVQAAKATTGEQVTFSAGPESNPYLKRVKVGGVVAGIKFEADNVARGEIDLSAAPAEYTHMAAYFQGKYSDPVPIPAAAEGENEKKKNKLLVVKAGNLMPDKFNPVRIETAGDKPAVGNVRVVLGQRFKVAGKKGTFNKEGTFTTAADGSLSLQIKLLGGKDVTGFFEHVESGEVAEISLLAEA